eukprot:1752866-Lingulodinium_polyedra.AAC.1
MAWRLGLDLQDIFKRSELSPSAPAGLEVCKELWRSWSATLGLKATAAGKTPSLSWLHARMQQC